MEIKVTAMTCRFCGEPVRESDLLHRLQCDGRQGAIEAVLADRPRFDGATYEPRHDDARLTGQLRRIWDVIADGAWHTLHEIAAATGDPEASVSAQLRHLRKPRFGQHTVERRTRGLREHGLYEYRLVTGGVSVQEAIE
jgi:hypothetical protein